jgi:hypothetical protein
MGRENYKKLIPWKEHCEMIKAIVSEGVPHVRYGVIIGLADDDEESLLHLEEALSGLYEEVMAINPCVCFQITPFGIVPIPGTPQTKSIIESGLLHFDDPSLQGGFDTPTVDTRYLSYKEIADWMIRLSNIGAPYF